MSPFALINVAHLNERLHSIGKPAAPTTANAQQPDPDRTPAQFVEPQGQLSILIGAMLSVGLVSFAAIAIFRFLFD